MSVFDQDDNPLSSELAALLATERTVPPLDADHQARLWKSVEHALVHPAAALQGPPRADVKASGAGARPASWRGLARASGWLRRHGVALVVGGALGAGTHAILAPRLGAVPGRPLAPSAEQGEGQSKLARPGELPSLAQPQAQTQAQPLAQASAAPSAPVGLSAASLPSAALPRAKGNSGRLADGPPASEQPSSIASPAIASSTAFEAAAQPEASPSISIISAERALLERGRVALGRGDWLSALEAIRERDSRFTGGALQEERDALDVQATAMSGRRSDAARKARAFLSRYPRSLFGGQIDGILRASEPNVP